MKETICTIAGVVGSFIAWLFGGWDASIRALLLFMAVDYATGLILACLLYTSDAADEQRSV